MYRQIKTIGFSFHINAERGDTGAEFGDGVGGDQSKSADNGKAAKLGSPAAKPQGGDHDCAKDAANAVDGEDIKRIVDLEVIFGDQHGLLTQDARNAADDQGRDRADKPRGGRDGGKSSNGAGDQTHKGRAAEFDTLPKDPGQ